MVEDRLGRGLTLTEAGALVGCYCWIERRLFALTGSWVQEMEDPATQIHLDEVSFQHAWHAELWAQRLPSLDGIDPESFVQEAETVLGPLLEGLGAGEDPGFIEVRRMSGLYRFLLPRLIAGYQHHLEAARVSSDAPLIRVLRLVLSDELESWQAGEALVQSLIKGSEGAAEAAAVVQLLEGGLSELRAGIGLVPWPGP